jgi:hypothetical protein
MSDQIGRRDFIEGGLLAGADAAAITIFGPSGTCQDTGAKPMTMGRES